MKKLRSLSIISLSLIISNGWNLPTEAHGGVPLNERNLKSVHGLFYIPTAVLNLIEVFQNLSKPAKHTEDSCKTSLQGCAGQDLVRHLKEIFVTAGVPAEWVWVAEVESSFDPLARSQKGARGLFQIMPETAERFGLHVNLEDERLDPEKNASVAAKYLKVLHDEFGSWRLALAAYNVGEGYVRRILRMRNAITFDEIEYELPSETRLYVAKVFSVVQLKEGVNPDLLVSPNGSIQTQPLAWQTLRKFLVG